MSHAVIFGLIGIGAGVASLGLSRLFLGTVVRGRFRTVAVQDEESYSRTLWKRMVLVAGLMVLIGFGFLIYGLLGGRLPRE